MLADQDTGATIDEREIGSGPIHRVLTSPEEIDELFAQTANLELAEQALGKLLNICGFQSFNVSIEQLSHLMNILSSRVTENMVRKTLSLLRELSEFRSPQIMNFLCQNESIMVIYSFFPNPVSARILSRCVEYSGDVRAYLLQKFASDPESFEKLLTTTDADKLEQIVVCMSSLFSMCEPSEVMLVYLRKAVEILCRTNRDSDDSLSFEVLKGLVDKLIPSHPSVVEVIAPALEMIIQACGPNEDLYFLLIELMQFVAKVTGKYEFMAVPSISAFVIGSLRAEHRPNDWENMVFASRMLTVADDISAILIPENSDLVPMFLTYYAMETKIVEKKTCVMFLGRCFVYQGNQQIKELLSVITIPMLIEWITMTDSGEDQDEALGLVLVRAFMKIFECCAVYNLDYDDLFFSEKMDQFLGELSSAQAPLGTFACQLLEQITKDT